MSFNSKLAKWHIYSKYICLVLYVFVETEICMMIVYRQGNSPTVMDSISLPCLNIIQDILQSYKAPPSPRKLDKSPSPGLEMEVRPPVNIQVESLTGSTGNFRSVFQGYCGLYGNPLDVDREFLMDVPGTFAACLWHFCGVIVALFRWLQRIFRRLLRTFFYRCTKISCGNLTGHFLWRRGWALMTKD